MNKKIKYLLIILIVYVSSGCNSYRYIHDNDSRKRQHELQNDRAGNACGDAFLVAGTILLGATTGIYVGYVPDEQVFKRVKFMNPTTDTMYVNMLADVYWDEENYCDFMDVRIPPESKCKLLLPLYANYNIYFGTTDNPDEDDLMKINTSGKRKFVLQPEVKSDSTVFNP